MRESIRRRPFICNNSYPQCTHEVTCKHATSSLPRKCHEMHGTAKKRPPSRVSFKKDTGKREVSSDNKNSSNICQMDLSNPKNNTDNSSNSDEHFKECALSPVIMDDGSIMLQDEHCHDSLSDQTIFLNLLSKLEKHLDEERKNNAKLQAELMDKIEYEKQLSDIRSNYEAEVFRLQNIITHLQGSSHYNEKITHNDEKLMNLNAEMKEANARKNNNNNEDSHAANINKSPRTFTNMDELRKEYEKQESLIAGYQRENEKLYEQIKKLRKDHPIENEDVQTAKRLTTENLTLRFEIEQLNKELKLRSQQIGTMLSRNSRLNQENQINELKESNQQLDCEKNKLLKDLNDARTEITNINLKINNYIREKNDLTEKYESFKEKSQSDYTSMKENFLSQIEDLQKKLRWYIENQSIIIKDSKKLESQARELEKLRTELSYYKSKQISGPKSNESKQSCDNKEDPVTESQQSFLLERIKFLESELDRVHDNEKRAIRSLQQQYERVKLQYEDRIQSLESYINSYCTHNQNYSNLSLQENHILKLNNSENIENKTQKISNETLKQSIDNTNQPIIISNLLDNLRGQITNLKIQLNQRQKTIEQMKHFAQLNNNNNNSNLNNNIPAKNKLKTSTFIKKQFHHPRAHKIQSRQINVINDNIKYRNKSTRSKQQNNADRFNNNNNDQEELINFEKQDDALKTLLQQNRSNKLERLLRQSQDSIKSGVTCDASTNTDTNQKIDNTTYVKMLERQIKNQQDIILSKETELNRLKTSTMKRNKHRDSKSTHHLNTQQCTNENYPSSLKEIEKNFNEEELMKDIYANQIYSMNLEADYWRNIALKMNHELNILQNDANLLVNILKQIQTIEN
ncbi:unnamed protein product [Schistosoma turkestanicum]|nr:unnamed protein product [Schistosoma turkestanicum]